ncbi:MAG: threonine--tRNA ligase [Methylacidiphilales bacterium]|nr:threonine--tRNA ligase [Candidatus Methylacidiphilales bacterium]
MSSISIETLRHSCAHLLAHAVKELYPTVQVTIGPVIEDGFYYDFYYESSFSISDLSIIEDKMREISARKLEISRVVYSRKEAIDYFNSIGEFFKSKIVDRIPESEEITLYRQGSFIDLCRGPHVENTGLLQYFKLLKVSGSYWQGDSTSYKLQRIYGTIWHTRNELSDHITMLEESEKRDHRFLGKQLSFFHFQEQSPGMPYWHPHGWTLYQLIVSYIRNKLAENQYQEISTPILADQTLWESSGHWEKFSEHMFTTVSEHKNYAIKPMNCPNHVQLFNQNLHSYRELPIRYAEFGSCHRNEYSGTLHGLLRVRAFVQDDAHIFCTRQQVPLEVLNFINLLKDVYKDFGFSKIIYALATRPVLRVGDDAVWDEAEQSLKKTLESLSVTWFEKKGEGAFYGPKIEFILEDCLKRKWQCGTIQCDFSMPLRLGASYVNEESAKTTPVMLHRAILGSLERFIGILIEHYAGALPLWLSPVQCKILTISESSKPYAHQVAEQLKNSLIRSEVDIRNEKIGLKIRESTLNKIPYLVIVGEKEMQNGMVSVRKRGKGDIGNLSLNEFISIINEQIHSKIAF